MDNKLIQNLATGLAVCLASGSFLVACGGGQDSNTNSAQLLASASATKITIPAANVTASSTDTTNVPGNAVDNDLNTHWTGGAASGTQWIQFNLGGCYMVDYARLAWYNGDTRKYNYTIKTSSDNGVTWSTAMTGNSDGTTSGRTIYDFPDTSANVIRVESTGNNTSTKVSLNEAEVWSVGAGACNGSTTTAATTTTTSGATTTISGVTTTTKAATTTTTAATTTTSSSTSSTLNTSKPPGVNFDLSAYKVTTFDSSGNVKDTDPIGSYTDKYFYTDPTTGAMTFYVPAGYGSTPNSSYPRSELRNKNNWHFGGTHTETVTMRVLEAPATGKMIIGQIHGDVTGGSEALKLRWTNGSIYAGVKKNYGDSEAQTLIKSGVGNSEFTYKIQAVGLTVTVSITTGGSTVSKSFTYGSSSWNSINMYFKVGDYIEDSSSDGSHGKTAVTKLITD